MYKMDLALNNLQGLICHKTKPKSNQIKKDEKNCFTVLSLLLQDCFYKIALRDCFYKIAFTRLLYEIAFTRLLLQYCFYKIAFTILFL